MVRLSTATQGDLFEGAILARLLPLDHELQRIRATIDWHFVDTATADCYSPDVGRPAYPAQVLFRILFLEYYATLSDVEVAEQCRYNLLYRAFVGLALGGATPDDTTLVVFRRRLGPARFQALFDNLVAQCQQQGLLEGRLKIVDATHVVANIAIPTTLNLLREARRRLVAALEGDAGRPLPELRAQYQTEAPLRGLPSAEVLATSARLSEALLKHAAAQSGAGVPAARELLEQVLRPTEGRISSVVDPEARLGHKTPARTFVGYKLHVAEDSSELVTTVQTLPGNNHEGSRLPELLAEEERKGVRQTALVADGLYDSASNRALARDLGIMAHIPRRHGLRMARFQYDPQTDTLTCPQGHRSTQRSQDGERTRYSFASTVCRGCPEAALCPPPNLGRVRVTLAAHHRERLAGAPSSAPRIEQERKRVERKFGQAKNNHGLARARYLGRAKVHIQGLLTFFVVNAKRMVRLLAFRTACLTARPA